MPSPGPTLGAWRSSSGAPKCRRTARFHFSGHHARLPPGQDLPQGRLRRHVPRQEGGHPLLLAHRGPPPDLPEEG
eukprot:6537692-Alexandrium_andersonii.AAC.1